MKPSEIKSYFEKSLFSPVQYLTNASFVPFRLNSKINNYFFSKFFESENPSDEKSQPFQKFWNLSFPRVFLFAKNIDLDSKNIKIVAENKENEARALLTRIRFQKFVEKSRFDRHLNKIVYEVATSGSAVSKVLPTGECVLVNLNSIAFDPTIDTIRNAPIIVERHYLTAVQISEKEGVWRKEAIDRVLLDEPTSSTSNRATANQNNIDNLNFGYEIFESYFFDRKSRSWKWIISYCGKKSFNKENILFEEEIKKEEVPYFDHHLGEYRGRWQRVGVVERLFELQSQLNSLVFYNNIANAIATKLILLSSSEQNISNALTELETGAVINDLDMRQLVIQNPAFGSFISQLQEINRKADELCFTPAIVSGSQLPANQPLGSTQIQTGSALSTFEFLQEQLGESIEYMLKKAILPRISEELSKKGIIRVNSAEELQILGEMYASWAVVDVLNQALKSGELIFQEQANEIKKQVVRNILNLKEINVPVPKNFTNFDENVTIHVIGTKRDFVTRSQNLTTILNMISANPAIIKQPLFRELAEINGISPISIQETEQVIEQENQKQLKGELIAEKTLPTPEEIL